MSFSTFAAAGLVVIFLIVLLLRDSDDWNHFA